MNDWNAWNTLLAVISTGTYDAAAAQLGINATTVSRRVRQLEIYYGKALLNRDGNRLVASPVAEMMLPRLNVAADALASLVPAGGMGRQLAKRRTVRITAVNFVCSEILARSLGRLEQPERYLIDLISEERNLSLTRREVDFALRFSEPHSTRVDGILLGEVEYGVFYVAGVDPVTMPWLNLNQREPSLPYLQWLRRSSAEAGPNIQATANTMSLLLSMVECGAGKALLPKIVVKKCPHLVQAPSEVKMSRTLWLLSHRSDVEAEEYASISRWIQRVATEALANQDRIGDGLSTFA